MYFLENVHLKILFFAKIKNRGDRPWFKSLKFVKNGRFYKIFFQVISEIFEIIKAHLKMQFFQKSTLRMFLKIYILQKVHSEILFLTKKTFENVTLDQKHTLNN